MPMRSKYKSREGLQPFSTRTVKRLTLVLTPKLKVALQLNGISGL